MLQLSDEKNTTQIDFKDELKKSYIDYAMSVIVSRALPDVRDGLKPVHRRILYAMNELNMSPDKPHRKSARIVGDVLGKFHPHGDQAVYDAMVRMAQEFNMLLPFVDGHGNFGSMDGDRAAAMRYTEARLMPQAMELLKDIDKNVVDFVGNFDNTLKEPVVLPTRIPSLLVNGTTGIAVGMATDIPPHNLREVIKAINAYIDDNDITIDKLLKHVKGPDFPTGGIITNKKDLYDIYTKGKGSLKVRAKLEVEDASFGKKNIVVTEIPYSYSNGKTKIIEKIADLMMEKKLDELTDIRDQSSKDGVRIVLEVKKGVDIDNLIKKLYKKTKLEDSIGVNMLALVNGIPKVLGLKEIIKEFVEFQKEINTRKYTHILDKAQERREVLEGLIRAIDVIDLIIEIIRGSKDTKMVKDCLIHGITDNIKFKSKTSEAKAKKLLFTERQATAILEMRLQKLIGLEIERLEEEFKQLLKDIDYYNSILSQESELMKLIKGEMEEIQKKYGQKRKTVIEDVEEDAYVEEFKEEELLILVDRFNYAKTVDINSYSRSSEDTISDFKHTIFSSNVDKMVIFTDKGNLYQIKTSLLPKVKVKDKGVPIENLCKLQNDEEILLLSSFNNIKDRKLLFLTKNGNIKIVEANEFDSIRTAINSTKLTNDDVIINITILQQNKDKEMLFVTKGGYALRFKTEEIPVLKKTAVGVDSIKLTSKDQIARIFFLRENVETSISYKLTPESDPMTIKINVPLAKRGGRGKKLLKDIDVNTVDFIFKNDPTTEEEAAITEQEQ